MIVLAFLTGSGVSCAASLPGTAKLTQAILSPSDNVFNRFEPTVTLSVPIGVMASSMAGLL